MKAVRHEAFGEPSVGLQFKEVAKPVPNDHQVLVRVHAASINALEWRRFTVPSFAVRLMLGGWLRPKDTALGADVAGVVETVGKEVTRFKSGDEVFGCAHGSFAEYALAREGYLTLKPANRSFQEAAAVPVAGFTALQAIRHAGGIRAGQHVLIQGASGGVGMYAVQLVKDLGAEVTAVCSTRNLELWHSFGADHVIDYSKEDFTRSAMQYDLIIAVNGYHSLFAYRRALKPQGIYVCAGGTLLQVLQALFFGRWFSQKGKRMMGSMGIAKVNQEDLTTLSELLQSSKIIPHIDRSYPLHETVNAFQYVLEKHVQGKVIIEVVKG